MALADTPSGLMLLAQLNNVHGCLEHSEKHIGQARECLRVIEEGKELEQRLKAIEELKGHLEVIRDDMSRAMLNL